MLYLFPASYLRLWDGRPPSNTTTSSRVSYSPGPTSFYLRVLEVPRVPRANKMLWIEDKCREKEVDFTKDVIYMYYRDLVK